MRSADGIFYLPAVPSPKPAPTEQKRVRESRSWPFRVILRQAGRDLSLTCPLSGLDLARRVSVWLGFARRALASAARRGRPQERFTPVFRAACAGSARRGFADLENRQRRKSFVGSNPTPSVFRNGFFSAVSWLLWGSSEPHESRRPIWSAVMQVGWICGSSGPTRILPCRSASTCRLRWKINSAGNSPT